MHVRCGMSLSKIQIHNGTGGLRGTTMNVTTLPELFTYSLEGKRELSSEKVDKTKKAISAARKDFL